MIMMYVRMLLALLVLVCFYALLIYFVPPVWEKIDDITWKNWNASLVQKVDNIFGRAQSATETLENKIDNPAPNTQRRIEQRQAN